MLENLIEKKDLMIYLDCRKKALKIQMVDEVSKQPAHRKELIKQRFMGRMWELQDLKTIVAQGQVKSKSKNEWKRVNP